MTDLEQRWKNAHTLARRVVSQDPIDEPSARMLAELVIEIEAQLTHRTGPHPFRAERNPSVSDEHGQ